MKAVLRGRAYELQRHLRRARIYGFLYALVTRAHKLWRGSPEVPEELIAQVVKLASGLPQRAQSATRTVLVGGWTTPAEIMMQAPIIAGFIKAGYRPVVILPSRAETASTSLYSMFGATDFDYWVDLLPSRESVSTRQMSRVHSQADVLAYSHQDARVGRYALSTMMRQTRRSDFDLADPADRRLVQTWLQRSVDAVGFAEALLARWQPDALLVNDQGYIPLGPLFERCAQRNMQLFTWNAAHRNACVMMKRYGKHNIDAHPTSLSIKSWDTFLKLDWTERHWDQLRDEISSCYRSGEWYGEVGTQFDKSFPTRDQLFERLRLNPKKRTVLLFPHIFWDGTFFWGEDLFGGYEEFFEETLKIAYENDRTNWVIKIHPANLVKDRRDGVKGRPGERRVIDRLGPLPPHICVLDADTDISTLSLFDIGDVCVTVRGTVGLEAACFGLTTVTAGTGRYDRLGFTIDPRTQEEFRNLLRRAEALPIPTREAIDLARRYTSGILLARPIQYQTLRFMFQHDELASVQIAAGGSATTLLNASEVGAIADFIESGEDDHLSFAAIYGIDEPRDDASGSTA